MPIPSLYLSRDGVRTWNVARAAAYGAGLGVLAASFKAIAPSHQAASSAANVLQIAGAALAFALLCGGAAALRNLIARRLIWPQMR